MKDVRLDAWLNYACLFKTRSQASKAVTLGRVKLNGRKIKPHHPVQEGEKLVIERGYYEQSVTVRTVVDHNVSRKEARELYEDHTPELTAEQRERQALDRILNVKYEGKGKPGRKDREALRRIKGT